MFLSYHRSESKIFSNITTTTIDTIYNIHSEYNRSIIYDKFNIENINQCYSCKNIIKESRTIIRCFDRSFCCKSCLTILNKNNYLETTESLLINEKECDNYYDDCKLNFRETINFIRNRNKTEHNKYEEEIIEEEIEDIINIKNKLKKVNSIRGFISILIKLNKNTNLFNKLFIMLITLSIIFYHKHISNNIK